MCLGLVGIIPGLFAGLMLMIAIFVIAVIRKMPKEQWKGWHEILVSGWEALWGLLLIIIILGGIYGGLFTPTEAAAVAAVYSFLIATFVYRDMGPLARVGGGSKGSILSRPSSVVTVFFHKDTIDTLYHAGKLTITLMFIIANALILKLSLIHI